MSLVNRIKEAAAYITELGAGQIEIGLILGSGLGSLADEIENPIKIMYDDIPHFPVSTVEGHEGQLVIGTLEGKTVMAMQGRFHYYEGYTPQVITFPVRVMKAMGASTLIVTNACGGMNPDLYPGALMFIEDHINFTFDNPLIGDNEGDLGPRFPDMSTAYTPGLIALGQGVADSLGIDTKKGVYAAISGPNYLGRAELKVLRTIGADTVGMSTIPETIVARHSGMDVLGISCVTDMAIAEELEPLEHEQVVKVANETRPKFIKLVKGILKEV
ncbi:MULTISPECIES: purine-nucleoside phosphorylase [unclassified Fusibacter]|uniref:purine-nucleoside phosphorylase n=1 Tax=unclassified Fusibacter TaxID=2624464 RepID=UPI001012B542|nr:MULTISPECIES: purine-nucleoside phosphorylase [unclassified Fusibacter]MCK8058871.1 purine-nucleoside phosphorylase [Fusibacter sp. A2]NPE21946.1 purine-nucleoside phosphorylase [Fusibacter sp. A1]RXV61514.1 purine-nucleoside phosphorylase [Fusibacter sp. A1]